MKHDVAKWMPFFGEDFLESERVAVLSSAAKWAYLRLLWRQWRHGSLPEDVAAIAAVVPDCAADLSAAWHDLEVFFPVVGGRRVNARCAELLGLAKAKSESARRSVSDRWDAVRRSEPDTNVLRSKNDRTSNEERTKSERNTLEIEIEKEIKTTTVPSEPHGPEPSAGPRGGGKPLEDPAANKPARQRAPSEAEAAWQTSWAQHRPGQGPYELTRAQCLALNQAAKKHGVQALAGKIDALLSDADPWTWGHAGPELLSKRWSNLGGPAAPPRRADEASAAADRAWSAVERAQRHWAGRTDAPDWPQFADAAIQPALAAVGGFRQLLVVESYALAGIRRRFQAAYRAHTAATAIAQASA